MKKFLPVTLTALILILVASADVAAQTSEPENESKTEKILKVSGKVAVETGRAAIKLGSSAAKATTEKIVIPAARILWDPLLTKVAPKVIGETAKFAGKGIKNGLKLIFKKDKDKNKDEGS